MIGCRCTWTPDDITDIDNIDDLEDRFLRVVYDITEEVAFNLEKSFNDKNITAWDFLITDKKEIFAVKGSKSLNPELRNSIYLWGDKHNYEYYYHYYIYYNR